MTDLLRYVNGEAKVSREDREIAGRAKEMYDEVRLSALKVEGAMALAGHIMEGLVELDGKRRRLSGTDEVLGSILAEVEAVAVGQCLKVQKRLTDPWKL